jgi:cysteinyl-tRNA synthetase
VWDVALFYTDAFHRDCAALGIEPPTVECKATDHIAEQIEQVQAIMDAGCAYVLEDGVYFDTARLPDYGKLARLDVESLKAGARVEVVAGKRSPADFALWKFSPPGEKRQMEWNSPWGAGFPGWHIECSAMATKYLGATFDIHTGGIDHIPVHHTNEMAQAEAAGLPFARYWMHGEFLVIKEVDGADAKMAKSGENFLTLQGLVAKGYDPLAYRYLCLGTHYRKQLSFSWDAMDGAANSLRSLRDKVYVHKYGSVASSGREEEAIEKWRHAFLEAVTDDLNMPQALMITHHLLGDPCLSSAAKYALVVEFDRVLSLGLEGVGEERVPDAVMTLVAEREAARAAKEWTRSDELRNAVLREGFVVQDTPSGPVVRPK